MILLNENHDYHHAALWHIQESEDFFFDKIHLSPIDLLRIKKISHLQKRLEFLAGRYIARWVTPEDITFQCKENDPPDTSKGFLSLSHTQDFASAIFHPTKRVGVDIEFVNRDTSKILKRFMSQQELSDVNNIHLAIDYWCAKEAVFKAGHEHGIHFAEQIYINWTSPISGIGTLYKAGNTEQFLIKKQQIEQVIMVSATLL